jgi:hypothetical protein
MKDSSLEVQPSLKQKHSYLIQPFICRLALLLQLLRHSRSCAQLASTSTLTTRACLHCLHPVVVFCHQHENKNKPIRLLHEDNHFTYRNGSYYHTLHENSSRHTVCPGSVRNVFIKNTRRELFSKYHSLY